MSLLDRYYRRMSQAFTVTEAAMRAVLETMTAMRLELDDLRVEVRTGSAPAKRTPVCSRRVVRSR